MRNLFFLGIFVLLLTTCQKENQLQDEVTSYEGAFNLGALDNPEEVFDFLAKEIPDEYSFAEIDRLKSLLAEPIEIHTKRNASNIVELAAGSIDGLQEAVESAGAGGTVVVKSGDHTEHGLVTITHTVHIVGEDDAVIFIDDAPGDRIPGQVTSGIWLHDADDSRILNLTFTTNNASSFACILVQDSRRVRISNNEFYKFKISVLVQHGDHVTVRNNRIVSDDAWQTGGPNAQGIIVINGKSAAIINNDVSNALFGIWACDKGGISWGNTTYGNLYGQIICKVPTGGLRDPDGELMGSIDSGNHWLIALNESENNFYAGFVVIDGAFKNVLLGNNSSGNGKYDIDLVGTTERFGFLAPTSRKNRVWSYADQLIKDCGEDNRISGGTLVDTETDPCDSVE